MGKHKLDISVTKARIKTHRANRCYEVQGILKQLLKLTYI